MKKHHTGNILETMEVLWCVDTGKGESIISQPVILNNGLLMFKDSKHLYAIDSQKGSKMWEFVTNTCDPTPPRAGAGSLIIVTSREGRALTALDKNTGGVMWHKELEEKSSNWIVGQDGRIYVGSNRDKIYALEGETGEKIWEQPTEFYMVAAGVSDNGQAYFISYHSKIFSYDGKTGELNWFYDGKSKWRVSYAILPGDLIYLRNDETGCTMIDGKTCEEKWQIRTDDMIRTLPVMGPDEKIYLGMRKGGIIVLDVNTGRQIMFLMTHNGVRISPTLGEDGVIYVGDEGGNIFCFNITSGEKKWESYVDQTILSHPIIETSTGIAYAGFTSNRARSGFCDILYALDGRSGKTLWAYEIFQRQSPKNYKAVNEDKKSTFAEQFIIGKHKDDHRVLLLGTHEGKVMALVP